METVQASPSFSSSMLLSSLENKRHALQLQLVQTDALSMYVQVSEEPFSSQLIQVSAGGKVLSIPAEKHSGGQRLKIPEKFHSDLLDVLLHATMVSIRVGSYETRIATEGFKEHLEKLMQPVSASVPVRFQF